MAAGDLSILGHWDSVARRLTDAPGAVGTLGIIVPVDVPIGGILTPPAPTQSGYLSNSYSGVVLNQNATSTATFDWRNALGGNWIYQSFALPANYRRGSLQGELIIPDLSGIQVRVVVDAGAQDWASLNYTLDYYADEDLGWLPLTSGTSLGAPVDGTLWFDLIFREPVPISEPLLKKEFRFGIMTGDGFGVNAFTLVSPTPLIEHGDTQGMLYGPDGFTPLLRDQTCSLNFRILGLVADEGINFLNNEYRSAVITTDPGNVDSTSSAQQTYWLSPPQPSRFAVQSLYFDVRPVAESPTFGVVNQIGNPSFEYDKVGGSPQWWDTYAVGGGTLVDQTVSTAWSNDNMQSCHMQYTFGAAMEELGLIAPVNADTGFPMTNVTPNTPVTCSFEHEIIAAVNCRLHLTLEFYAQDGALVDVITDDISTATVGGGSLLLSTTAPANALFVQCIVRVVSTGAGHFEGYVDTIQTTFTTADYPYFDGDTYGYQWTGPRGNSPSVKLIEPTTGANAVVIDGVTIDPLTPNMACNVYYSTDDTNTSEHMTEDDWEGKLWTRIPQSYLPTQRTQFVFPTPVLAGYMKLEFTNLQPQAYDPGNFQKTVQYKKFPTWVANFFIAQMEMPQFTATHIDVVYDALRFAYDYYLDDLTQAPQFPTVPPASFVPQLTNYFNTHADQNVDEVTLSKINLVMNIFADPTTVIDKTSTLGSYVTSIMTSSSAPPTKPEGGVLQPVDRSTVSSLAREPLLFEQALPVMYYFIPCRHGYKEVSAPFEYNRAYFAGVKDVAWIRNHYTIATDTPLYIESGADEANAQFNDWVFEAEDLNWYAY